MRIILFYYFNELPLCSNRAPSQRNLVTFCELIEKAQEINGKKRKLTCV